METVLGSVDHEIQVIGAEMKAAGEADDVISFFVADECFGVASDGPQFEVFKRTQPVFDVRGKILDNICGSNMTDAELGNTRSGVSDSTTHISDQNILA